MISTCDEKILKVTVNEIRLSWLPHSQHLRLQLTVQIKLLTVSLVTVSVM